MEENSKIYKAIRELICLAFYAKKNFQGNQMSLDEHQYKDKKYEIYSSWVSESQTSIFIKCGNEIIHLTIEDDLYSRCFGGWVSNDVYFHLNKYKDIDVKNVVYSYPLYGLDKISKENVIYKSKIKIDYSRSDCIYTNPNRLGTCGFKAEKFIFNRPDYFDKKLENGKYVEVFKDVFSPEIILNFIEQIYPNFEQININNKIDKIIKSLSQKELLTLKERLQEQDTKELVRRKK